MGNANHENRLQTEPPFNPFWLQPTTNSLDREVWRFPYQVELGGRRKQRVLEVSERLEVKNTATAADVRFVGKLANGEFVILTTKEHEYSLILSFEQPEVALTPDTALELTPTLEPIAFRPNEHLVDA